MREDDSLYDPPSCKQLFEAGAEYLVSLNPTLTILVNLSHKDVAWITKQVLLSLVLFGLPGFTLEILGKWYHKCGY